MEFRSDGTKERGNRLSLTRFARSLLVIALAFGIGFASPAVAIAPIKMVSFVKRTPVEAMAYARTKISNPKQWGCLRLLWTAESNWRPNAYNHTAVRIGRLKVHAGGIPQILGMNPSIRVEDQIQQGFKYITNRYKTPCQAWSFHLRNNWY